MTRPRLVKEVTVPASSAPEPRLSVVIPMYNEAARMRNSLPSLLSYLAAQPYSYEVIAVDDGSADNTVALARELLAAVPDHRVIETRPNRGKGHALRAGMPASRGQFVLFTDADLSTPPAELEKFWPWLEQGVDVVIGSRKMAGAVLVRRQPWLRERMGKVFTWLSDRLATRDISDVTCGFKVFTRPAAHDLFRRGRLNDFSFDAEILFLAQRRGYTIKEVPVTWHDERGTTVRLVRDAMRALRGLLRIRANAATGRYGDRAPIANRSTREQT
ncbi:MAG TPA: dolichyl-phosphate beta-glucosyltransferase [Chloroflexia bacterium]|nr:dolichyl-phosphate beta-glucosyltransferase [Chloroflexia bacterium]